MVKIPEATLREFFDFSESPGAKETLKLRTRLRRLEAMGGERVATASQHLATMISKQSFSSVTVRREFVRLDRVRPGSDASDRRAPAPEDRPPATRLITPRGANLRFYLIALFVAQAQRGSRAGSLPGNPLPVVPRKRGEVSWIDMLSSEAQASGSGKTRATATDKKIRQVKGVLDRLAAEELVRLPNAGKVGKHEQFELMRECGFVKGIESEQYKIPRNDEPTFEILATLFTNGWIQVLEDTEIAFLLMIASLGADTQAVAIDGDIRLLHYGLSREAYTANRMLDRLGLITVTEDPRRTGHGKVEGYKEDMRIMLNRITLHWPSFERDAFEAVTTELNYQLGRPPRMPSA